MIAPIPAGTTEGRRKLAYSGLRLLKMTFFALEAFK